MTPDPSCGQVCLTLLPRELRQQVWGFIQTERPGLAELLTGQEANFPIEKFKEAFGPLRIWVAASDTGLSPEQLAPLMGSPIFKAASMPTTSTAQPSTRSLWDRVPSR